MKAFYKNCSNIKQVNSYLKKIGLGSFAFDQELFDFDNCDFDFDGWINAEETMGVSVQVTMGYEVFCTKYSKKDIDRLNKAATKHACQTTAAGAS